MKSRGRLGVLMISVPVLAFAVIGGFMGQAMARQESYQSLRIFEDVVTLIVNNYVEEVQVDKVMQRRDARAGRRARSRQRVSRRRPGEGFREATTRPAPGRTGLELTRQYYLRVIAARDGSPAARAGLRPGDYIRAIDGQSTRDTSVYEGMRLLAGKPGTKVTLAVLRGNAAEPHTGGARARGAAGGARARPRSCRPASATCAIAEFGKATPDQIRSEVATLDQGRRDATRDRSARHGLRRRRDRTRRGAAVRRRAARSPSVRSAARRRKPVAAAAGDGSITLPVALLTDNGTSGAGGALRRGAHRQQARVARRRAHARPRRTSASRAAARRQRTAAHAPLLPHAGRSGHQREGADARRRRRTTRRRVRSACCRPTDATLDKAIEQLKSK